MPDNNGCSDIRAGLNTTMDSFLAYVKDAKPYHTKILEVVQRLIFNEAINLSLSESITSVYGYDSGSICNPVGFGVDLDNDCGFDALKCCNFFDCDNGYGLVYDNSDVLVNVNILGYDLTNNSLEVEGDFTYDKAFNIISVPDSNTVVVEGSGAMALVGQHNMMVVAPIRVKTIKSYAPKAVVVDGNISMELHNINQLFIQGGDVNSGGYGISSVTYDGNSDTTTIGLVTDVSLDTTLGIGEIVYRSATVDRGRFNISSAYNQGGNTVIKTSGDHEFTLLDGDGRPKSGAVVFRTGLIPLRAVSVFDSTTALDSNTLWILSSEYNAGTNRTTITLNNFTGVDVVNDTIPVNATVRLIGYDGGVGFDGEKTLCSLPAPNHMNTSFIEELVIVGQDVAPSYPPLQVSVSPTFIEGSFDIFFPVDTFYPAVATVTGGSGQFTVEWVTQMVPPPIDPTTPPNIVPASPNSLSTYFTLLNNDGGAGIVDADGTVTITDTVTGEVVTANVTISFASAGGGEGGGEGGFPLF